jgi:protoporphyrinogen oxidase
MGTARHTHVISTLPAEATASLCHNDNGEALVPSLSDIPAVTVMVVNLYFRTPNLLPVKGFGYLIPQNAPFDHNPERALGVVFDSFQTFQDTVDGTKVTVMLGGHWWDGWTAFPDSAQGVALARALLKRHLYISEEPEAVNAVLQRNCIPQYTVGHHERLERAHAQLLKVFHGKVRVAGSSYFGVGVHDCAAAALNAALSIKNSPWASVSGLEQAFESVLAF